MSDENATTSDADVDVDAGADSDAEQMLSDAMKDDAAEQQADQEKDWKAEADKWKESSRKHEQLWQLQAERTKTEGVKVTAELRELRRKAAEYDKYQDSQKSDQQKLTEKLTAAEVELAQYRTREVRMNAAVAAGLPADMAKFITEVESDAALEQAQELAKHLKAAEPKPVEPKPADLRQGARGATAKPAGDPNAWLRNLAGRA